MSSWIGKSCISENCENPWPVAYLDIVLQNSHWWNEWYNLGAYLGYNMLQMKGVNTLQTLEAQILQPSPN